MDELLLDTNALLPIEADLAALIAEGETLTRATELATENAIVRASGSPVVVLVEGISDAIALEIIAARCGRRLTDAGAAVVPMGGVTNLGRFISLFGSSRAWPCIVGLYDKGAEDHVRKTLEAATRECDLTTSRLESLGFYACVDDLEDELIRALGTAAVEEIVEQEGQIRSFRTMQREPHHRDRPLALQLLRFVGRSRYRYARVLAEAVAVDRIPSPVRKLLDHIWQRRADR